MHQMALHRDLIPKVTPDSVVFSSETGRQHNQGKIRKSIKPCSFNMKFLQILMSSTMVTI